MKLRIISGNLGRRNIVIPNKIARFRPTMELVRGAIADYLGGRIQNAVIADLCAGSGAIGIEMLSRGAKHVFFVEKNRLLCESIRKNVHLFNVEKKCTIINKDLYRYIKIGGKKFDIIYFDPPYDEITFDDLIPDLLSTIVDNGIVIIESKKTINNDTNRKAQENCIESRKYGKTCIDVYTRAIGTVH